ncbi:MAG: hypothetical protein AMS16_00770, partial [Planctomycetes bacterium DG_58]
MSEETVIGSENKGDCRVTVKPADALQVEVVTKSRDLFEPGIRKVVSEVVSQLGVEKVTVGVEDQGALDYVILARVEA